MVIYNRCMNNSKLVMWGMVDSVGVFVYTLMVGWLMINGNSIFGEDLGVVGPALFLMLFVFSALVTGLLVFGRPVWLYLEHQKKAAVKLLLITVLFMFLMIMLMLIVFALSANGIYSLSK